MIRVQGNNNVKPIECVNPVKDKWRVRWDAHNNDNGSADYMEVECIGKPTYEYIKALVSEWYNERTKETILSGFVWRDMAVWLSSENQFNYKAAYDLAVQSEGCTLPVTFKFGTDDEPVYHTFSTVDELADFYTKAMQFIQQTQNEGWKEKDSVNWNAYKTLLEHE